MNLVKYLKENPRKILENLTSYLTIIIALLGVLIAEGSGIGLTPEFIASTVAVTAILNRILTFIRVNYLKNIELE
jgi:hypothetical protein